LKFMLSVYPNSLRRSSRRRLVSWVVLSQPKSFKAQLRFPQSAFPVGPDQSGMLRAHMTRIN
jgi:hypothetical protein